MKNIEEKTTNNPEISGSVSERDKRCMEKYCSGLSEKEICNSENISQQMLRNIFYKAGAFLRITFETRKENEFKNCFDKALLKAEEVNRIPFIRELKALNIPDRLFAEIREELTKRKYKIVHPVHLNKKNDTELLDELKRLKTLLNRTPNNKDISKYGTHSASIYYSHFGSLTRAQKLAGLTPNKPGSQKRRQKQNE